MVTHIVDSDGLYLRGSPARLEDNAITLLPQGHGVRFLEATEAPGWWRVSTEVAGQPLEGFVTAEFLKAVASGAQAMSGRVPPEVHLPHSPGVEVTRRNERRAHPLNEVSMPRRRVGTTDPAGDLTRIIEWLDVENDAHLRWKPIPNGATFCNIYAYDVCYLAGAYLPRVWWKPSVLQQISNGSVPRVEYNQTVSELRANGLFDWLNAYGKDYGWQRVFETGVLQDAANQGRIAVICAQARGNAPGHISLVVPETPERSAVRKGGSELSPLQSQAGRRNLRYFTDVWWKSAAFLEFGFWIGP